MSIEGLRVSWTALLLAAGVLATPAVAEAAPIWDGDASLGTGVFKAIGSGNCGDGSLTVVTDGAHGQVWRYHKPTGVNRCESHGIRVDGSAYVFQNNTTYFIGWWSKLSSTANNNANFQWKSYGNHLQNAPVVLKMVNGRMTLIQRQPGAVQTVLWSRSITANTWNHFVLGLKLSSAIRGGHVELWFNGVKQTFTDGSDRFACRTFDGDHNCPKWGVFGATGSSISNFIDGLRVGTTFGDVGPSSTLLPLVTETEASNNFVDPAALTAASGAEPDDVDPDDEVGTPNFGCGVGGGGAGAPGPFSLLLAAVALAVARLARRATAAS
jgi:hypothetical protein